jgi:hypothetical protein
MRLWFLRPRAGVLARESHPWRPWFDKVFGIVVRAQSEAQARALAQSGAGTEGLGIYRRFGYGDEAIAAGVWLDPAYTACDELDAGGPAGIVLADRREA